MSRSRGLLYHYRHWHRYQEILSVLIRNGFGFVVERLDLPGLPLYRRLKKAVSPGKDELANLPQRVARVLGELGPTFIKLGQLLSTRADLLPAEYLQELSKLQDHVPPLPSEEVEKLIVEEFGRPINEIFAGFEPQALASASIGQVHRATLPDGQAVVVKIRRPGVARMIRVDLEILEDVAKIVEHRTRLGRIYNITGMLAEFRNSLLEELDFTLEGRNAEILKKNMQEDPHVYIPKVYWDYTTERVLVLEYVKGRKITNRKELLDAGFNPRFIAQTLVDSIIKQIYIDGFFHSDPHPGNLAIIPGNKIVFLDFGQVGHLDEELREKAADLVLALARHDIDGVLRGILRIGIANKQPDLTGLRRDISRLERKYYGMPLSEIQVGVSIQELMEVAWRHQIQAPSDFVMAVKALVTLEGTIRELAPDISLVEIAEPFARRVILHRYDPRRLLHIIRQNLAQTASGFAHLPALAEEVIEKMRSGRFVISVENRELPFAVNQLRRGIHHLALSMILSSLLIAGAILVSSNPSSFFVRFHLSEIIFGAALLTSLLLMITILLRN